MIIFGFRLPTPKQCDTVFVLDIIVARAMRRAAKALVRMTPSPPSPASRWLWIELQDQKYFRSVFQDG